MERNTSQQPSQSDKRTISQPGKKSQTKKGKKGGKWLNKILVIGILVAIALFFWAERQRQSVMQRLEQTEQQLEEVKKSTEESGDRAAQEILNKVRAHIDIPTDPQPTVATIVDVEKLRQASDFYNKAENGDSLIITRNRAILYNKERDIVIDVVPVQINQQTQGAGQNVSPSPSPEGESPSPSPSPEETQLGPPPATDGQ